MAWTSNSLRLLATLVLVLTATAGAWAGRPATAQRRAPSVWPKHAALDAMTCSTVGVCFAVGENTSGASLGQGRTGPWQGLIAATRDGGNSWTIQHRSRRFSFMHIACPNVRRCYATGSWAGEDAAYNSVLWTQDGGRTWHALPQPSRRLSNARSIRSSSFFARSRRAIDSACCSLSRAIDVLPRSASAIAHS